MRRYYKTFYILIVLQLVLLVILCRGFYRYKTDKVCSEDVVKTEIIVEEKVIHDRNPYKDFLRCMLNVKYLPQLPELPTGCEITSLTTVLNYYHYDVSKEVMTDTYLDKGKIGKTNPNKAFIGSPYNEYSFGCYPRVIVEAANQYLSDMNSNLSAVDISGDDFKELESYVSDGYPVIIWVSINLSELYVSTNWYIDGEYIQWLANEHCVVLIGYDIERDVCVVSDPLKGIIEYPRDLLIQRYNEMGKYAVLVY